MSCVMVNDGSSLNVYLKKFLPILSLTEEALKHSSMVIKSYDDPKRKFIGTFEAEVSTR